MRYTGHLDLRRAWERMMRRANLPLAYSEGYTPHPLLNLASPLPLGFTSTHEVGDFWMSEICDLEEVTAALQDTAPPGIEVHHLEEVPDLHGDKLPTLIQSSQFTVTLPPETPNLESQVAQILAQTHLQRTRKKKEYDLRPLIEKLEVIAPNSEGEPRIKMQLSTLPGATGRPDEVLRSLGVDPHQALICRTDVILEREE